MLFELISFLIGAVSFYFSTRGGQRRLTASKSLQIFIFVYLVFNALIFSLVVMKGNSFRFEMTIFHFSFWSDWVSIISNSILIVLSSIFAAILSFEFKGEKKSFN